LFFALLSFLSFLSLLSFLPFCFYGIEGGDFSVYHRFDFVCSLDKEDLVMRYLTLCTVLLCGIQSAEASGVCTQEFGLVRCSAGAQEQLDAHGSVYLTGTDIQKQCTVHGYLSASHAKLQRLDVYGTVFLDHSVINKRARVLGYLTSSNSMFKSPIRVHGQSVLLDHSNVQSLDVTAKKNEAPEVWLKDHTEVQGDITFHHQKGTVFVDKTSSVHGKVVGGLQKHV
jgi:hypothetical protein